MGDPDQAPHDPPKPTRSSGDNVWPLPPFDPDPESPETTNALSVLKSAQASAKAAQIAASIIADAAKHQSAKPEHSEDVAAHHAENSDDSIDPAAIEPTKPKQTSFVWTQEAESSQQFWPMAQQRYKAPERRPASQVATRPCSRATRSEYHLRVVASKLTELD
jgi:hypothetical protein